MGEVTKLDLKMETDYLDLSAVEETGHSRTRPFLAEMTVSLSMVHCQTSPHQLIALGTNMVPSIFS